MIDQNQPQNRRQPLYMTATERPATAKVFRRNPNVIATIKKILHNLFRRSPSLNRKGVANLYQAFVWIALSASDHVVAAPYAEGSARVSASTLWLASGSIMVGFEYFDAATDAFARETISIRPKDGAIFRKNGLNEYERIREDHPAAIALYPMFEAFAIYCPFDASHKKCL